MRAWKPKEGVIKRLRIEKKLSQRQVAYNAGVSECTVADAERCRRLIHTITARAIAVALGVMTRDIAEEVDYAESRRTPKDEAAI